MEGDYKEVYFHQYCNTCQYHDVKENEEPCHSCLAEPFNVDSHKPIKWKEK